MIVRESELMHYGVLGMKWGHRKTASSISRSKTIKNYHEDYLKVHDGKKAYQLSDSELKKRNKRLQAEEQYTRMTQSQNKGKKAVKAIIGFAGTLNTAYGAYKTYERFGRKIVGKIS